MQSLLKGSTLYLSRCQAWAQAVNLRLARLPGARSFSLVFFLATLLGFFPAFAGLSYPSALLFGLLVPTITACSVTRLMRDSDASLESLFGAAVRRALLHQLALTLPLVLHALRVGWCTPGHDFFLWCLGPLAGIFMAMCWAVVVSIGLRRAFGRQTSTWLVALAAAAGPLFGILSGLWAFYRSPMVFAFDPFVGFFAGSPYDTGFDPTERLLTYRTGSVGTVLALIGLVRHCEWDATFRPRFRKRVDWLVAVLGTLGFCLSVAVTSRGVSLGHRSTAESIREALGDRTQIGRCEIIHSSRQKAAAISRLGQDCNAWLRRLERRLGAKHLDHVTAYVFDGAGQKELLMGAAHTQIAKPWRQEIYLNGASYPDDVVGHELAHIVAGQVARGPFAVAGSWFGWLPNPGLIEGLAVALAPDEDGDLTPLEWARALQDLGQLPRIEPLFTLSFFSHTGTMAYTVAGAFVEFIGQSYGKPVVRAWYRGQSLESLTRSSFEQLEHGFLEHLKAIALPPLARDAAKARFSRQGLFSRRCPHAVDRTVQDAEQRLEYGDAAGACRLFTQAQSLDPTELKARFGLGDCARGDAKPERAVAAYQNIAKDASLPDTIRERAEESLADYLLLSGNAKGALTLYAQLAKTTLDADRRRTLEVKSEANSPLAIAAIKSLLIGETGQKAWDLAVRDLLAWSQASPSNALPEYLLGRNYWHQGRETAGTQYLDRALDKAFESPDIRAEALRIRAVMACATGDFNRAIALSEPISTSLALPTPRRLGALRLIERCAGKLLHDDWPETRPLSGVHADRAAPQAVSTPAAGSAPTTTPNPSVTATPQTQSLPFDLKEFECPAGMAKIPGATFWMGSERGRNSPDETPRFQTKVSSFCLDLTEVTVAAYAQCVTEGHCSAADAGHRTCNGNKADRQDHPVNCVDYTQAETFCKQRHARLPTEIEWEYAARGGTQALKYPWGEGSPDDRACWKSPMSCPVKKFPAYAFGLFDISGNVWEWTSSDYGPYPYPPLAEDRHQKVYRGGSWSRRFEKWMHLGLRNRWSTNERGAHLGLRCAASVPGVKCPFATDDAGNCLVGVLAAQCPAGETWNGERCARPHAPTCEEGRHAEPGHGCVRDIPLIIHDHALNLTAVKRARSPEFDADCRKNQPKRPQSYRYFGGEHEARNVVSRRVGCKNRDVGAGWNSTCCP